MAFLFRCPTRTVEGDRLPAVPNPKGPYDDGGRSGWGLMRHIDRGNPRPVAVLVNGTTVTEKAAPTVTEQNAATYCYLGGRDHLITQGERDLLVAAGYTVLVV